MRQERLLTFEKKINKNLSYAKNMKQKTANFNAALALAPVTNGQSFSYYN